MSEGSVLSTKHKISNTLSGVSIAFAHIYDKAFRSLSVVKSSCYIALGFAVLV